MSRRVVFDCMVFLQAVARPDGPAAACFRLVEQGFLDLCLSPAVVAEVREVLSRPELRRKFPSLTDQLVTAFLDAVVSRAVVLSEVPAAFPFSRDPKDAKYLHLAAAAGAPIVVSRDRDLLDLPAASDPESVAVREHFPHLRILDSVEFLRDFSSRSAGDSSAPPSSAGGEVSNKS